MAATVGQERAVGQERRTRLAAMVHANKDIQIEPDRVKRIQNVVNSHV